MMNMFKMFFILLSFRFPIPMARDIFLIQKANELRNWKKAFFAQSAVKHNGRQDETKPTKKKKKTTQHTT